MKHTVIMAGTGGRGVLVAAYILAQAASEKFHFVSWLPSITSAPRGGPCEATIVFSDSFASPLVWRPQTLVIMETTQFPFFVHRVLPGGLIITESAGLQEGKDREAVKIYEIPAMEIALKITGDTQAANMVLLGAYIQASKTLPPELIERQIEKRFSGREEVISQNIMAFREGLKTIG